MEFTITVDEPTRKVGWNGDECGGCGFMYVVDENYGDVDHICLYDYLVNKPKDSSDSIIGGGYGMRYKAPRRIASCPWGKI